MKLKKPSRDMVIGGIITLAVALGLIGIGAGVTFAFLAYKDYKSTLRIDTIEEVDDIYSVDNEG